MPNDTAAHIIQNDIHNLYLRLQCLPQNEEFNKVLESLAAARSSMSRGIRELWAQQAKAA